MSIGVIERKRNSTIELVAKEVKLVGGNEKLNRKTKISEVTWRSMVSGNAFVRVKCKILVFANFDFPTLHLAKKRQVKYTGGIEH